MIRYASPADIEQCRRIQKQYGTTYYCATRRFPKVLRDRVYAIYAFVRIPDEWVDNPGDLKQEEQLARIESWRQEMVAGTNGVRPESFALRAFCDVVREAQIPIDEAMRFLDAMARDVSVARYETFEDLQGYMRGSASAVGIMMCYALGVEMNEERRACAMALGEAMQLTNFLRDVGEDWRRRRVYLPQEDLRRFGISDDDIDRRVVTPNWIELMKFEIERARRLYALSDEGIAGLPPEVLPAVLVARILYSRILDRIEASGYDVFNRRCRTSTLEKAVWAARVGISPRAVLGSLGSDRYDTITN